MIKHKNPFNSSDGKPELRRALVAWIDLLGFKDVISERIKKEKRIERFRDLHTALRNAIENNLIDRVNNALIENKFGPDPYAFKAFSDNIVIAFPIQDDGELELGLMTWKLAGIQFELAIRGFFLRGGISIGEAYVDDYVVFGGAVMDAYKAENRLARDPRIVFDSKSKDLIDSHLSYYDNASEAPHCEDILLDTDGQYFLNYLSMVMIAVDHQGPFYDLFIDHKRQVESGLKRFQRNPLILSKYLWLAKYHNYFCDFHCEYFSDNHRIDIDKFSENIQRIR